ncbi:MAG: chemotaxis protein CheB [Sulfurisoma sp.]|nr:chemotaxis protein CheB [Sulfurisoma sp.]
MATRKAAKKAKPQPPETPASDVVSAGKGPDARFPIVGIGASAGGLEAYEQFFRSLPAATGLAYVLVSHLDPGHVSILTEILQRSTAMPVVEAQDQMAVLPNRVHVIPPNRDMAIFHGILQLSVPEQPRGQRMPIDAFLRSLAEDQGERAIGVILSGTGTDGTLGLRAILGAGGISLVQEPDTAKYDGMPASAIRAGCATHVLAVEKMPAALLSGARNPVQRHESAPAAPPPPPLSPGGMNKLLLLLRSATGHDFSLYKKSTIGRRIERRMAHHDLTDMEVYVRYLKEHPTEIQVLFKELLINVTSFFRDPEAFAALRQDILPQLFADKPEDYVFRVWVAGCATGEEVYSIAILLRELMNETHHEIGVQIYGTDLDDDAIAVARAGLYPPNIAADVTPERLRRFFVKDDAGYRIKKDIREMVVFAIQNVIKDPPFTKMDLVSCRNLMIYLEPELQNRLIPAFHYALRPNGVLFLSPSESLGSHSELFAAINRKWKLYRVVHSAISTRAALADGLSWTAKGGGKGPEEAAKKVKETNVAELTRRALLQSFAPASVVADHAGDILYVHGETGKYLRPAPGHATLNVVEMAREGLQLELRVALHAASEGKPTLGREVSVKTNGDFQTVSLDVRPLLDTDASPGLLLVSFRDVARPAQEKSAPATRRRRGAGTVEGERIEELERDLAYTRENLQSTIEEQQASNEELKSTNEEMQSTNEELQSTNEELETSKEELQSVNEELITVNAELQAKIEQLAGMQNDMKNLLDNINVGTIFLDEHLFIRRFTRDATRVYRLVATDVGRPLADIKADLDNEDLLANARTVLDTLVPWQREVRMSSGKTFFVRIQPYRTLDNIIEGAVLTFTDITQLKQTLDQLLETQEISRMGRWDMDLVNNVLSWSAGIYRLFEIDPAKFGATYEAFIEHVHPDDRDRVNQAYLESLRTGQVYEITHRLLMEDGRVKWVNEICHTEYDPAGKPLRSIGTVQDITVLKLAEDALAAIVARQTALLDAIPDIVAQVDKDKVYTWMNPVGRGFFGDDAVGRPAADYFIGPQETYTAVQPIFEGSSDVVYVESWQRRHDGQKRLLAWWCRAIMDGEGRTIGALSTARDITPGPGGAVGTTGSGQ